MKTLRIFGLGAICSITLSACGGPGQPAQDIANAALDNAGCKLSQSELWNSLQLVAENGALFPARPELRTALLKAGELKGLKGTSFERYVDAFMDHYSVVTAGIQNKLGPETPEAWKKALAEAEIGLRVTEAHSELQDQVQISMDKLERAEKQLNAVCANPDQPLPVIPPSPPPPSGHSEKPRTVWEQLQMAGHPEVYGARKTLAVAYQSCDVLTLPAMTSATPSVEGIKIVGNHPSGGKKREIASLASVNASHNYIKNNRLAKNSCFEVRNSPMIYDFGGKPYTTASNTKLLNMFKNGGTGTNVLGIDCSAYVFSALATAGLKMHPDPKKPLKADLVHGIGSRAFKEPQDNGLRCLEKIAVSKTKSIEAGDIAAINGHVVMIDEVGKDPFGLNKIARLEDCNSTKILAKNFDFVIAQSSPSKSGIGINRFQAKDYLKESGTYNKGLVAYAVASCRARFGAKANLNSPDLSVIRHKKTAECKADPLVEQNESCVDSCEPI